MLWWRHLTVVVELLSLTCRFSLLADSLGLTCLLSLLAESVALGVRDAWLFSLFSVEEIVALFALLAYDSRWEVFTAERVFTAEIVLRVGVDVELQDFCLDVNACTCLGVRLIKPLSPWSAGVSTQAVIQLLALIPY
jgi:hypothetical protein